LGRGGKGLAFALAVGVPLHEWLRAQVQLCDAGVERVNLHRTLFEEKEKEKRSQRRKRKVKQIKPLGLVRAKKRTHTKAH
jgi:MinD superfamily P-loop ATPase